MQGEREPHELRDYAVQIKTDCALIFRHDVVRKTAVQGIVTAATKHNIFAAATVQRIVATIGRINGFSEHDMVVAKLRQTAATAQHIIASGRQSLNWL